MRRARAGFPLRDRHVLLTGGSRGIGPVLAGELVRRGSRVTLVARSGPALEQVASQLGAHAVVADLADPDHLDGLVGRVEERMGPVDVLVNNAALAVVGPYWTLSAEEVCSSIALNVTAPLELTRQVLPGMLARDRGVIVNLSSFAALAGVPSVVPYSTSKAGIAQFTATLQRELAMSPVRAVIVHLGEVDGTDMMVTARLSPPVRVATARLNRLRAIPKLQIPDVARAIAAAIEAGRSHLVLPRRMAPMHHLREIPNRLNDLLLAGSESKLRYR